MENQTLLWLILGALVGILVLIGLLIVTIRFFLATILIKVGQKLFKKVVKDVKEEVVSTAQKFAKEGSKLVNDEFGSADASSKRSIEFEDDATNT